MNWILGGSVIAIALIAVDHASRSYCARCRRAWAVFRPSETGYRRVCRRCLKRIHREVPAR